MGFFIGVIIMFIDRVEIELFAGKGGNGTVAWRREKFIPKGGPSGGNGGKGGCVIFQADDQVPSLEWFRNRRILKAESGAAGGSNSKQGFCGEDLVLKVPCGTLVKDADTGEILCDITIGKQKWIACYGGRGGRGNESFKTSVRQAPNWCTEGTLGGTRRVELELKLIADIGLVGFPNAGKSTLINAVSHVQVKIAPYPFTTLRPNLGHIWLANGVRVLIADIPGIIEGAHRNRGLGFEFLRHIERTTCLVYVLDASGIDGRDPMSDFAVLQEELSLYSDTMLNKPFLVVLNKVDTEESVAFIEEFRKVYSYDPSRLLEMSAMTKKGIPEFVEAVQVFFAKPPAPAEPAVPDYIYPPDPNIIDIE